MFGAQSKKWFDVNLVLPAFEWHEIVKKWMSDNWVNVEKRWSQIV